MTGITRRTFLQGSGLAAGGLVVGCALGGKPTVASGSGGPPFEGHAFDAYLQITSDDRVILQVPKVEMGQGTFTGLATLVAEELEIAPEKIQIQHAPVHEQFQAPLQITGGSNSLATSWEPVRRTGAQARESLRRAAAERWGVAASGLRAQDGAIVNPASGARLTYGELAEAAARAPVTEDVALKPPSEWKHIGRTFPRLDAAEKSRGSAMFGIDTQAEGLLTAVIVRSPYVGGRLVRFDAAKARAVPGVEHVIEVPNGVAVVATSYWRARKAAGQLEIEWDPGQSADLSTASIRVEHRRQLAEESGKVARESGNARKAIANAERVIEAEYWAPFLAHAPMEPMNCTIVPRDGGADVWVGSQAPDLVQDLVAERLGLAREDVTVHTTFLGGGFGRRGFADYAAEAAEIVARVQAPIKLVWSREDDTAHDFFRPPSTHRLRAVVGEDGRLEAWEHRLVASSIIPYVARAGIGVVGPEWARGAVNWLARHGSDLVVRFQGPLLAREGGSTLPYEVPNLHFETLDWDPGIRVGMWRSVGHSHNGFVVEGFIDELAHVAGRDPAAFRRELLRAHPRHLAVLDLVVEKAGWGQPAPGRFQGIAVHESFDSVVAEVAEVSVADDGEIRVHKVTCAIDCGIAVNPDIVRAQMESGIIYGLTAALKGEISFEGGRAQQSNFHDYPMLRMNETPEIEVHIAPSDAAPTGVGEPATPPIAPAVANAVFAATGQRLRELPLKLA